MSESQGGLEEWIFFPDEGQDAPVVVGVGVEVQDLDARDGADGVHYARNLLWVATLAEVRDGFEELRQHRVLNLSRAQSPVEVDGGAYEGQVGEGLREVSQCLAGGSYLLGVEP